MKLRNDIKVIGFDADDTLWVNETYYREAEDQFCEILEEYVPAGQASKALFETETKNLPYYGYGIKAFTLSLLETAMGLSDCQLSQRNVNRLLGIAKQMIDKPVELLEDVDGVLRTLKSSGYRLIVATKGDLLDQERKLKKSGIESYFHHIEIMSDKQEENYQRLLSHLDIKPAEFLMIGNSVKSDILPVINLGGSAIHVPFHTTWAHEQADPSNKVNFPVVNKIIKTLDIILENDN